MKTSLPGLMALLFALVSGFVSFEAQADIVFLNMNGSATEIPAVQAVARKNGERVFFIPQTNTGNLDYGTKDVMEEIKMLAKQGVRPRMLISSGHHARNLGMWGSNGEVSLYYLQRLMPRDGEDGASEVRAFFAGIDSLYLWGCYTGILGNVYRTLDKSNEAFKNVNYVVAFGEKGPLNTDPLSGRMLKDILEKESALRSGTLEQTFQTLKTVPGYQQKDLFIHRGQNFVSQLGVSNQQELQASCREEGFKNSLGDAIRTYWDFYWNKRGPIPEDTSKGELRQAYRMLQRNSYCLKVAGLNFGKDFYEIPEQQAMLQLLFYRNVITNFSRVYSEEIRKAQDELQKSGITGTEVFNALASMERGALMAKLTDMHAQVKKIYFNKKNVEQQTQYIYLSWLIDDIEWVLYPTKDFYTPLRWIDPNSTDASTTFQILNDFGKGKTLARSKAESGVN